MSTSPPHPARYASDPPPPGEGEASRLLLAGSGVVALVIELSAERNRQAAAAAAVLIGVAQRIDAAAIFLLIKFLALADFDHAGGAAALAPVEIPIAQALIAARRTVPA